MAEKKKKKSWNSLCTINGEVMTVEERNRRIKLEYVNGGKSLKDLALQYGLTYNTLRVISCEEKWKDYKEAFAKKVSKEAEDQLTEIYVATKVDVNLMYNNAWQVMMQMVVNALATRDGIRNKHGELDVYKLNQLADVLTKAHQGQQTTTGFISKEAQAKIDIQREAMDIKKLLSGLGEDEVIDDNFIEMLEASAKRCGITKDSIKENPKEEE